MYDTHIVIDFEMNPIAKKLRGGHSGLGREIIEIGAVKLNRKLEIVAKFRSYVKPEWNSRVEPFITRLTGIHTEDIQHAPSLCEALELLLDWVGSEGRARTYSWSMNDFRQLADECREKGLEFSDRFGHWQDFQRVYSRLMGYDVASEQMALRAAAEQFGIRMDARRSHGALYDAEITTELLIQALSGEYRKQARLLREMKQAEAGRATYILGDACGCKLQQLLEQMRRGQEVER